MVEFFHDIDFLVDVFLKEGLLFDMEFADDFDSIVDIGGFWL